MSVSELETQINRFKVNEERLNTFVNVDGFYTTSSSVQVPTLLNVSKRIEASVENVILAEQAASIEITRQTDLVIAASTSAQEEFLNEDSKINTLAKNTIADWQTAITTITQTEGVPALAVSTANNETQQEINDSVGAKWYAKGGGYPTNYRVMLDNGDIVKSTINGNTNNPNVDMTGWEPQDTDKQLKTWSGRTQESKNLESLSIEDFGADTVALDNSASILQSISEACSPFVPYGKYPASADLPLIALQGDGIISTPNGDVNVSPVRKIKLSEKYIGDVPLSAINQMGQVVINNTLYVVNQGSYNGTQHGTFEIYDITDARNIKKLSVLNIGAVGAIPRSLAIFGKYAYVRPFSNPTIFVIDISNKTSPTIVAEVPSVSGNSEHSTIMGGCLVYTFLTGKIAIYSLANPKTPQIISELVVSGVLHQPLVDGAGFWVTSHNNGSADNLFYVDCSNVYNPKVVSQNLFPTLKYCRFPVIQGRYMYVGGLDATSRLNILDISDKTNPVLVHTSPTIKGSWCNVLGDVLIADSKVFDITNPSNPVYYLDLPSILYKTVLHGSFLIGFGEPNGAKGPSGNDSYADTNVVSVDLNGFSLPCAGFGSVNANSTQTKTLKADSIETTNLSVGGGFGAQGMISGPSFQNGFGLYNNSKTHSEIHTEFFGSLDVKKPVCVIEASRTCFLEIDYRIVDNLTSALSAKLTMGKKATVGYILSDKTWTERVPVTDCTTPLTFGSSVPIGLSFTVEKTTSGELVLYVQSSELTSGNAYIMLRVYGSGVLSCRFKAI